MLALSRLVLLHIVWQQALHQALSWQYHQVMFDIWLHTPIEDERLIFIVLQP